MTKIMVVDDEPEILATVRLALEGEGFEVTEARDGYECLRRLRYEKPDLILLDVMMPGMDGWEVCRKIKNDEKTRKIPVAMFTIRTSWDSIRRSFEYAHCDAHINKPFDKKKLVETVRGLLEGSTKAHSRTF